MILLIPFQEVFASVADATLKWAGVLSVADASLVPLKWRIDIAC